MAWYEIDERNAIDAPDEGIKLALEKTVDQIKRIDAGTEKFVVDTL